MADNLIQGDFFEHVQKEFFLPGTRNGTSNRPSTTARKNDLGVPSGTGAPWGCLCNFIFFSFTRARAAKHSK
jgi:hypothetical protein